MRIELNLGGRAGLPAGLLVLGKAARNWWRTRSDNRSRRRCARRWCGRCRSASTSPARRRRLPGVNTDFGPNSDIEQAAARRRRCRDLLLILLAAVVLRQRHQDGAALAFALGRRHRRCSRSRSDWMRSRLSRICWILLLSGPHCCGLAAEQHEEAVFLAAGALRHRLLAIDLGLLAGRGFLELAELFGAGGVAAAAVERLELGFEPGAVRILLRPAALRGGWAGCCAGQQRRENGGGRHERAAPSQFHRMSPIPLGLTAPCESDFEAAMVSKVWTLVSRFYQGFGGLGLLRAGRHRRPGRRDSANRFHNTPQMIRPAPANTKPSSASP